MIYFYVLLLVLSFVGETFSYKNKIRLLALFCVVLAWGAGTRADWPDQLVYQIGFEQYTPALWDWSLSDEPFGYREHGFFFLGILCKSITSDVTFYFCVISFLTFVFLFQDIKKYNYTYPLIGLCVYVSRFFVGRNLLQIRAGLCYAIILLGVRYISKRDWFHYFLIVFIAYLFHSSALVAIPLYFLPLLNLKKKHIFLFIGLAFLITIFFTPFLQGFITDTGSDLDTSIKGFSSYLTEEEQEKAKGLANPMIYYQVFLLFAFVVNEKKLKAIIPHYYTIRDAYFYSTFILITFSMFLTLSARTSTLFATFEIVIIPSLIEMLGKKNKWIVFLSLAFVLIFIMLYNLGAKAFRMPVF